LQENGILEALLVGDIIEHVNIQVLPAAVEVIDADINVHLLLGLPVLGALGISKQVQLEVVHGIHYKVVQEDAH
jgi:hypothetical protein